MEHVGFINKVKDSKPAKFLAAVLVGGAAAAALAFSGQASADGVVLDQGRLLTPNRGHVNPITPFVVDGLMSGTFGTMPDQPVTATFSAVSGDLVTNKYLMHGAGDTNGYRAEITKGLPYGTYSVGMETEQGVVIGDDGRPAQACVRVSYDAFLPMVFSSASGGNTPPAASINKPADGGLCGAVGRVK